MQLKNHIALSKAHQKKLQVFPGFFTTALNEFYFLTDEFGFRKPELDTWRNEANLIYKSENFRILIAYEYPNMIEITFKEFETPGYVTFRQLLQDLGISFSKDILKISEKNDMYEIEAQMALCFKTASSLLKENWESVSNHFNNSSHQVS